MVARRRRGCRSDSGAGTRSCLGSSGRGCAVSEVATRLADARPSEPLTLFAQRAAMGAEAFEVDPTGAPGAENTAEDTRSAIWRNRLGLIQLAIFSIVVIVVLVVRYLEVAR